MNTETALAIAPLPELALARKVEPAVWNTLRELYDGASDQMLAVVVDYCAARKLDPIKKPVHIVPVWSNRRKCMVETIWPSVSETRITAMRTKTFAGMDETKFGPTQTQDIGTAKAFQFPEWAQLTVYRMIEGQKCAFPGPRVYFLESYAQAKRDDYTPNSMWAKRTWGQLEKCAEAAALRRAFPEESSDGTAEEMAGREVGHDGLVNVTTSAAPSAEGAVQEVKRAAVPRKNRGAAALQAAPSADTPAPITSEVGVAAEKAPDANATIVEEKKPEAAPVVAEEKKPEPAKAEAAPEPKTEKPAPAKADEKPSEWPKVVNATVDEVKDAEVKNNPKYKSVKVAILGGGKVTLNGQEIDVARLGRVVFDPTRPELLPFAKLSDELIEFTIEEQASASNPAAKNRVIVKAQAAEVAL